MFALSVPASRVFSRNWQRSWNPTFQAGGQEKDPAISLASTVPCNKTSIQPPASGVCGMMPYTVGSSVMTVIWRDTATAFYDFLINKLSEGKSNEPVSDETVA